MIVNDFTTIMDNLAIEYCKKCRRKTGNRIVVVKLQKGIVFYHTCERCGNWWMEQEECQEEI